MPKLRYFQTRAVNRLVTGADCFYLLHQSTVTHRNAAAAGAPPAWVPHSRPPHPHAHIAGEGFARALSPLQDGDYRGLRYKPHLSREEQARLDRYRSILSADTEGLHLDPRTRGAFHPRHRVVDPVNGPAYVNRTPHSQFEDGEISLMALTYALNSPAGAAALLGLTGPGRRAVLTSRTAANALAAGPLLLQNPSGARLSEHPLRGKTARMIRRGPGGAGEAPRSFAAIGSVVSVLDYVGMGELRVTTHYPTVTTAPCDFVQRKGAAGHGFVDAGSVLPFAAGAAAAFRFSDETACVVCVSCGAEHGHGPSGTGGRWHRCSKCGSAYCAHCGDALEARCDNMDCDGTTSLVT